MTELLGNKCGIQTGHQAYCRIGMTAVVWRSVPDSQCFEGRTPLLVQVRCLFYVLAVLGRWEDEGSCQYLPDAFFPTFCILLGEFESIHRPVIEQDEAITAGLRSLLDLAKRSTHVNMFFSQIDGVPFEGCDF